MTLKIGKKKSIAGSLIKNIEAIQLKLSDHASLEGHSMNNRDRRAH